MDFSETDEWLFSSLNRYLELHMYNTQYPVRCISSFGPNEICVSCTAPNRKTELITLLLPEKLLTTSKNSDSLKKNRDFTIINGGFNDLPITALSTLPSRHIILSAEESSGDVAVWKTKQTDSDLLEKVQTLSGSKTCSSSVKPRNVRTVICDKNERVAVFGSSLSTLCLADLESGTSSSICSSLNDAIINKIERSDHPEVYLTCEQSSGDVWMIDSRQSISNVITSGPSQTSAWTFSCCKDQQNLWLLNHNGNLRKVDLRMGAGNSLDCIIGQSQSPFSSKSGQLPLDFKAHPDYKERYSVSGSGGCVHIFDLEEDAYKPVFQHDGHQMCAETPREEIEILSHLWHPANPACLISSSSDGSMHACQCKM